MTTLQRVDKESQPSGRHILSSLVLARIAMQPPGLVTALLLIDIGLSFGYPVGITGQIRAVSALVAAISSLLLAAFSVKISYRSLLLLGLFFFCVSSMGVYFASVFSVMVITYAIYGFGLPIVGTMTFTLVATHFPLEQRARKIGWILASPALGSIFGIFIINLIAETGGWRLAFLGFVFPVSLLSFVVAATGIPSLPQRISTKNGESYITGLKAVFKSRSAVMCLLGTGLFIAGRQAILVYSLSYFREYFQVSTRIASLVFIGVALGGFSGSMGGGHFVNQVGRKLATVITAFLAGIFTIAFLNYDTLWLAFVFVCFSGFFNGMLFTAASSLSLEQLSHFKGSMMSLNSAADNVGASFGAAAGGMILLLYNYGVAGIVLGLLSLAAALIFLLLVQDPTVSNT